MTGSFVVKLIARICQDLWVILHPCFWFNVVCMVNKSKPRSFHCPNLVGLVVPKYDPKCSCVFVPFVASFFFATNYTKCPKFLNRRQQRKQSSKENHLFVFSAPSAASCSFLAFLLACLCAHKKSSLDVGCAGAQRGVERTGKKFGYWRPL
jgi:hypothetical protein